MTKSHTPYPLQVRQQIVDLVIAGKTPEGLSH